jgi:Na+-translocating ferredoxin:NAD+ oxidoreductase RnfE subunit
MLELCNTAVSDRRDCQDSADTRPWGDAPGLARRLGGCGVLSVRTYTNCLGIGAATLSALAFVNGKYIAMIALAIVSIGMAVIARRFPRRRAT